MKRKRGMRGARMRRLAAYLLTRSLFEEPLPVSLRGVEDEDYDARIDLYRAKAEEHKRAADLLPPVTPAPKRTPRSRVPVEEMQLRLKAAKRFWSEPEAHGGPHGTSPKPRFCRYCGIELGKISKRGLCYQCYGQLRYALRESKMRDCMEA